MQQLERVDLLIEHGCTHLTDDEISGFIAGTLEPDLDEKIARHVENCSPECGE